MTLRGKEANKICIIVCKQRGLALPSDELLMRFFQANDDGFGLAYHHKGDKRVTILKGAMTMIEVRELIAQVPNPIQANILLHFRMATEGRVCPENCHPYPLTTKDYLLKATALATPVAIAHNGIVFVKGLIEKWTIGKREREFSDTQKFIKHFFAGMGMTILNRQVTKLISLYVGGKFAFLTPQGFHLIGEFYEKDGLYYSHLGFEVTTYVRHIPQTYRQAPLWVMGECDLCGCRGIQLEIAEGIFACKHCFTELGLPLYEFALNSGLPYHGNYGGYNGD